MINVHCMVFVQQSSIKMLFLYVSFGLKKYACVMFTIVSVFPLPKNVRAYYLQLLVIPLSCRQLLQDD